MQNINHLPPDEQQNYMLCPYCNEYVDLHNLPTAVNHVRGNCKHHAKQVIFVECNSTQCVEILEGRYHLNLN